MTSSPERASLRLAAGLLAVLVAVFVGAMLAGALPLDAARIRHGLAVPSSLEGIVLYEIRLPRALLAPLVGAGLGLAGAALQGFLRNPLAEPSVLGAPQMAALGAAAAIFLFGIETTSAGLALSAIGAALLSVAAVALVAGRGAPTTTLLVAGLALASLASAALAFVLALADNPFALAEIVFWLIGSLEDRSWQHVALAAPPILLGSALLLTTRRALTALVLGEETARGLGIPLDSVRWRVAMGVALAVGGSVAVAGAIGFVGLLAPHLVRPLSGNDPGRTLVPAALAGAVLVGAADLVARLIPSPNEIKVGMVTALIGVPVFLVVLLRHRAAFEAGR